MGGVGRVLLAMLVLGCLPAEAAAVVDLTAHRVRIGDHPAFVRVVVDFTDGRLGREDSEASDPDPFRDGRVTVEVRHRRVQAQADPVRRFGVGVRVRQGANRLRVRLTAAPGRFKYLERTQLRSPERLVLDLYRSRPGARAQIRRAPGGCLALRRWTVGPGRVRASGTARHIFESSFQLLLRDARGRVVGSRIVTFGTSGRWTRTVTHRVARRQRGTLEAVALSARDGALDCLAQVRVRLEPPAAER